MNHEDKILNCISQNQNISQRKLAKLTDLSIGHLNLLLHKMVNKGLVKIEKVNARSLKYLLTPQGIERNVKRTYKYIKNAVKHVLMLKSEMDLIYRQYKAKGYTLYIDGEKDEIYQILDEIIKEEIADIKWVKNIEQLKITDKQLVIVWQSEIEEKYKEYKIEMINILERIKGRV